MSNLSAPFIRTETTSRRMTVDVLLAALPLCAFSVFNYGIRPALVVLLSMLSALVCEGMCCLLRRKSIATLLDGSAAVTAVTATAAAAVIRSATSALSGAGKATLK